jgi:hypothetical protein
MSGPHLILLNKGRPLEKRWMESFKIGYFKKIITTQLLAQTNLTSFRSGGIAVSVFLGIGMCKGNFLLSCPMICSSINQSNSLGGYRVMVEL